MRQIVRERPDGVRWVPDQHSGTGVLVLAGSSGRIDSDRARLFAEHGHIAESIRWFGGAGQHSGPWEIPLETFLRRIDDLATHCDRVYVVGTSFGAEAALLSGALSDTASGVVAFAPSDVVWAGFDADGAEHSHWTLGDAPLPYVPIDDSSYEPEDPPRFLPLYDASRRSAQALLDVATIPVERIANLILVAGGDDQVWPSVAHARRIVQLRSGSEQHTAFVTHRDAGHRTILPGESVVTAGHTMRRGGTEAADRALGESAWSAITAMLAAPRETRTSV